MSTWIDSARKRFADWIPVAARFGYAAKGLVYFTVGCLALRAAWTFAYPSGAKDALQAIGRQPFGQLVLALTAVGLFAYAAWRFFDAFLDLSDRGTGPWGLPARVGITLSGFVYAGLGLNAARYVLSGRSPITGTEQDRASWLLSQPFGKTLLGLGGLIMLGIGLRHFQRSWTESFLKSYRTDDLSSTQLIWLSWIGRMGLASRGITFALIGVFIVYAAVRGDSSQVKDLGGALAEIGRLPLGAWLLGIVGAGFVTYGVYCFSRSAFRRFEV